MSDNEAERGDIINHSRPEDIDASAQPEWLQERLEWFQDRKFGLFMHWGIYSVWGVCESWPLVPEDDWARPDDMVPWKERDHDLDRFSRDYRALNKRFNPDKFKPENWVKAAKRAGMNYVCLTTKHHDGFCLWDTKTTDYKSTGPDCPFHSNPRANIVKETFDAFRNEDFAIWCYFSKSDWHTPWYWHPDFPVTDRNPNYDTDEYREYWENFVNYTQEQMKELLSDYGKIDCLWLDGGQVNPRNKQDIRMDEIARFGRELQPGLIIADRTVGGPHENFITPEQTVPDEPLDCPWESCVTMGTSFSYRFGEEYKPAGDLIILLIDIVAKGGNLLLNVAPSPNGNFDDEALERLYEIGDWMDINGEAIYGTRPVAPYRVGNVRFTSKEERIFALVAPGPEKDFAPELTLEALPPGGKVAMLGLESGIEYTREGEKTRFTIPVDEIPDRNAYVLSWLRGN